MILHTYWRSSAAYRVRIALALKGLDHEKVYVHLTRDGGEHLRPAFAALNPQRLVPALELDGGAVLTQSMARTGPRRRAGEAARRAAARGSTAAG